MTVIGLTGGIASGKSTAASWLKEMGAVVIDADRLGHRVYEPGTSGFEAVVNGFGHDIVAADGTINRQLLGGKVFGRPEEMKRLTDIVWPEIRRLAREEVAEIKRRDKKVHIVLEAAVLVEANWFDLVDEVWVVTVEPEVARARLMARNGLTEQQAQARIDSQLTNKERSLLAYAKIDNSGTLDEFRQKVEKEWKKLLKRTGTEPAPAAATAKPASNATRSAPKSASTGATATKAAATKVAGRPAVKAAKPAAKSAAKSTTRTAVPKAAPAAAAAKSTASSVKAAPARQAAAKAAKPAATKSAATKVAATKSAASKPATKAAAAKPAAKVAKPAATKTAAPRAAATRTAATKTTKTAAKATAKAAPAARRAGGR